MQPHPIDVVHGQWTVGMSDEEREAFLAPLRAAWDAHPIDLDKRKD